MIKIGPTGRTIQGTVYDCNKTSVEKAIQNYDALLYIKWNPTKNYGMGCWELRRRPEQKSIIDTVEYEGTKFHVIEYKELDIVNHVFDLPVLGYHILERLRKSDVWAKADYDGVNQGKLTRLLDRVEETRLKVREDYTKKLEDNALYELKQDRALMNGYREAILSGQNPADIARYWGK